MLLVRKSIEEEDYLEVALKFGPIYFELEDLVEESLGSKTEINIIFISKFSLDLIGQFVPGVKHSPSIGDYDMLIDEIERVIEKSSVNLRIWKMIILCLERRVVLKRINLI